MVDYPKLNSNFLREEAETHVIRKYQNRRLYDTKRSQYVTLDEIRLMIQKMVSVKVVDAKTNEDITRSILIGIIAEQELTDQAMIPEGLATLFLRLYGNEHFRDLILIFLERNLSMFWELQDRLGNQADQAIAVTIDKNLWSHFVNVQGMLMENMINSYLDQSSELLGQLERNIKQNAQILADAFAPNTLKKVITENNQSS